MQKPNNRIVVIPDMAAFVREVSEYGNVGATLRRVLRLPILSLVKLAWINKHNVILLAKKDFAAGMLLLVQIELLTIKTPREYVAVRDQVVDLAVALKNTRLLEGIIAVIRSFGYKPVLVTNNLSYLVNFLGQAKINDVWVSYSNDPEGYAKLLEPQRIIPYELVA